MGPTGYFPVSVEEFARPRRMCATTKRNILSGGGDQFWRLDANIKLGFQLEVLLRNFGYNWERIRRILFTHGCALINSGSSTYVCLSWFPLHPNKPTINTPLYLKHPKTCINVKDVVQRSMVRESHSHWEMRSLPDDKLTRHSETIEICRHFLCPRILSPFSLFHFYLLIQL